MQLMSALFSRSNDSPAVINHLLKIYSFHTDISDDSFKDNGSYCCKLEGVNMLKDVIAKGCVYLGRHCLL